MDRKRYSLSPHRVEMQSILYTSASIETARILNEKDLECEDMWTDFDLTNDLHNQKVDKTIQTFDNTHNQAAKKPKLKEKRDANDMIHDIIYGRSSCFSQKKGI